MKEAYVSFNTAKLLKEKGFDWPTIEYYSSGGGIYRFSEGIAGICGILSYPRPTQQMACRWLRKEKGIHILPEISEVKENPKYYCMIWKTSTLESFIIELFDSYEDAIEAALEYVLKNLI